MIHDDLELATLVEELDAKYAGQNIPRPKNWGGYNVTPSSIEFWQGRPSRLHDRFRYRRETPASPWLIERIAP